MDLKILLFCSLLCSAFALSMDDPWLRDPLLVGLWKLTRATNCFGYGVFHGFSSSTEKNVLICPFALSTVLGVLHFGSVGETQLELANILAYTHYNLTKEEAAQAFYLLSHKHLVSSRPRLYVLEAPSTIVVNRPNGLSPTFKKKAELLYQCPITVSNFLENAVNMIQNVNDWVAGRTRNRIKHVFEMFHTFADMIVLSAAYFRGVWVHKFEPQDTYTGTFYNFGLRTKSKSRKVQMMRMANELYFHSNRHHSFLELPFKGRNVSMIIVLPRKFEGIYDEDCDLSPENLEKQIVKMVPTDMKIAIPKFRIHFSGEMSSQLKLMGGQKLFQPKEVDFSLMLRRDAVKFGEIRHVTTLSVSEKGVETSAPAATSDTTPTPIEQEELNFNVNHPFMFVIYEKKIKMALMIGRVTELD